MYQIITKPIKANKKPPILSCFSSISLSFNNIFFIFDGNKAYKIPSINKKRPNAMINSFMINFYWFVLGFVFPKNLKNSLSGDNINEVSPPINAFS